MPVKKDTTKTVSSTKKTPTRAKATTVRKTSPRTKSVNNVAKTTINARHIEENTREIRNNSKMIHVLYGIIIVLMMIIAGLAFYVGTLFGNTGTTPGVPVNVQASDITITIIDDARCADCPTQEITKQLQVLPFLDGATFVEQDYGDKGVSDFLVENEIVALPAVIFSTNILGDNGQIAPYLQVLPDGSFSLALGANFDPFAKRSENGFLVLESEEIEPIVSNSYIDGNEDAQITWVEYSDMECPYCAGLHNEGTVDSVKEKYGEKINVVFQNFPLDFHKNALAAAQGLECIGAQDSSAYYTMIDNSFEKYNANNFDLEGFYDLAEAQGINRETLQTCVNDGTYKGKVLEQMEIGKNLFGITGTPGNVVINNETGEYTVISGKLPASAFEEVIDKMLN